MPEAAKAAPTFRKRLSAMTIRLADLPKAILLPVEQPKAKRAAKPKSSQTALLAAVDQKDIQPRHRMLADTLLRLLPSPCSTQLKNFYVRYDNPQNRGLGGDTTIILDGNVPDSEFLALLGHECGHLAHAHLSGDPDSGDSAFRDGSQVFHADSPAAAFFAISWQTERVKRAGVSAADFVSGYAASDAFEDFAETYVAWLFHRPAFEERARGNAAIRRKLEWMRANMPGTLAPVASRYKWNNAVPWDMTRLPYDWNEAPARRS